MYRVCASDGWEPWEDAPPTHATETAALTQAAGAAADAALDLLEARGLELSRGRREEVAVAARDVIARGEPADFPRLLVADKLVERCTEPESGRTAWRARLLIEYPIGLLRGDLNNVLWQRRRLQREAEVVRRSGEDLLGTGRWMDGLRELARALELLDDMGGPLDGSTVPLEEAIYRTGNDVVLSLSIDPVGSVEVVEAGASAGSRAAFACTYTWSGERVPAAGVPIAFELAAAALDDATTTDSSGIASTTLETAYGSAGRRDLRARLDMGIVRAATGGRFGSGEGVGGGVARQDSAEAAPVASQAIYVVEGGHGISACVEFEAVEPGDALQAKAGFTRRMERDGYLITECSADVDVVVRGRLSMTSEANNGAWSATAALSAAAFDQRVAQDVGETTVTVTETSTEDAREAEVLALKEAGRLLGAYLTKRILMHGG
jgi:hypothetical protein